MGTMDKWYARLPVWAQHGAVSTYGLYWYWVRFGSGYQTYVDDLIEREKLNQTEWQNWQSERLRRLLTIAATHVPYYQKTWSASEKELAVQGRLDALPLLAKEPIRADPQSFVRDDIHARPRLVFYTSGSTGTPIATHWTLAEMRHSLAVREARSAQWAGVSFNLPRATFSGRMAEPNPESKGPFYRFNMVERQVYFSPFHLRPDTARFYVDALRKHRIQWMTGYAVSYYLLAKFILEQKIPVPPLKAVITTSEKLTPEMRVVMESAYQCRVYEEYSTVENALFVSECEQGRLHVSPDWGIVEILNPDGTPCAPNQVGEVVATCLIREYQPLIRYRLGDMAMWDSAPCSCGRSMPVIKEVVGRIEDVVVGPDGRQMVRFHGIFVNQPHVREGQIIQESLTQIRVKVVPTEGFDATDIQDITHRVQQRLTTQVQVIVEPVNQIPRGANGKFRAVVSCLNQK